MYYSAFVTPTHLAPPSIRADGPKRCTLPDDPLVGFVAALPRKRSAISTEVACGIHPRISHGHSACAYAPSARCERWSRRTFLKKARTSPAQKVTGYAKAVFMHQRPKTADWHRITLTADSHQKMFPAPYEHAARWQVQSNHEAYTEMALGNLSHNKSASFRLRLESCFSLSQRTSKRKSVVQEVMHASVVSSVEKLQILQYQEAGVTVCNP